MSKECRQPVKAEQMTWGEYLNFRQVMLPEGDNPCQAGFRIEYIDGTTIDDGPKGHINWVPLDIFERDYTSV